MTAGCGPKGESSSSEAQGTKTPEISAPIRVRTANAAERPMPHFLRVTGQLQGMQDAQVVADAVGKVIETPVERGSVVEAGDVLAKVDKRTAELTLTEAQASVALAEARLVLAKNDVQRNTPLSKTKAIAEADFQKLETDLAIREADLATTVARRDLARKSVSDSVIRAPFAGQVVERYIQPGEYVRADTRVARIVETTRLRLLLNIPETEVGNIREGQTVEFTTAAYPGELATGVIRFIGGAVRESARDLIVEAEVPNGDGRLKPGFFVEARIRLNQTNVVAIPFEALRIEGSRRSVFIVENGTLIERLVEIGETNNGWIELRQGVRIGETTVLSPDPDLTDGVPVEGMIP
jgi:membrane fusion protein, multidrug efflux system